MISLVVVVVDTTVVVVAVVVADIVDNYRYMDLYFLFDSFPIVIGDNQPENKISKKKN